MRLDHVVIKVDDLDAAVADYAALGLPVTHGGEHPRFGSHNALVTCADGSYLELIAFRTPAPRFSRPERIAVLRAEGRPRIDCRWLAWASLAPGLADFAVAPDAGEDWAWLSARELDYDGPLAMSRQRPDGREIRWEMGFPNAPDLPFFIRDLTPRSLRVPALVADDLAQPLTIAHVDVLVSDAAAASARYTKLFGPPRPDGAFLCGATAIVLVGADDGACRRLLCERGEGVVAIELAMAGDGPSGTLDMGSTHGAHVRLRYA